MCPLSGRNGIVSEIAYIERYLRTDGNASDKFGAVKLFAGGFRSVCLTLCLALPASPQLTDIGRDGIGNLLIHAFLVVAQEKTCQVERTLHTYAAV